MRSTWLLNFGIVIVVVAQVRFPANLWTKPTDGISLLVMWPTPCFTAYRCDAAQLLSLNSGTFKEYRLYRFNEYCRLFLLAP